MMADRCRFHKWKVISDTIRILSPAETGRRSPVSVARYRCGVCGHSIYKSTTVRK
jgi:hypothetical protein